MALELSVIGPGVQLSRVLQPGDPELIVGRDVDCDVCLPDPQRTVSRRHLAVWNAADRLHFRVLSVVNGVELPSGLVPPRANGVLALAQTLRLAEYNLTARLATTDPANEQDPWSVFDRDGSEAGTIPAAPRASLALAPSEPPPCAVSPEEDPFGDWGFETTLAPGAAVGIPVDTALHGAGDLAAFFRGLGLDPAQLGTLGKGELEEIGVMVRTALLGLVKVYLASATNQRDLHADDGRPAAMKHSNPLQSDGPDVVKLQYLFGGKAAAVGLLSPAQALRELVTELLAHDLALQAAARAAVEGTVREFSPPELMANLLGGGSKVVEGGTAWGAFCKHYSEQAEDMPEWVQRLLDKYFSLTYLRESERIKRDTTSGKREPGPIAD